MNAPSRFMSNDGASVIASKQSADRMRGTRNVNCHSHLAIKRRAASSVASRGRLDVENKSVDDHFEARRGAKIEARSAEPNPFHPPKEAILYTHTDPGSFRRGCLGKAAAITDDGHPKVGLCPSSHRHKSSRSNQITHITNQHERSIDFSSGRSPSSQVWAGP